MPNEKTLCLRDALELMRVDGHRLMLRSPWTPDEDTELRRLHAQRPALSFTAIAVHIGRPRNACIGRAHRLKLPNRSKMRSHGRPVKIRPPGWKRRRGPVSPTRLVAATSQKAMAKRPEPSPVRAVLLDGSAGCLWPSGERPFVFCGCQVKKGLPYCEPHAALAYRPRRAA